MTLAHSVTKIEINVALIDWYSVLPAKRIHWRELDNKSTYVKGNLSLTLLHLIINSLNVRFTLCTFVNVIVSDFVRSTLCILYTQKLLREDQQQRINLITDLRLKMTNDN